MEAGSAEEWIFRLNTDVSIQVQRLSFLFCPETPSTSQVPKSLFESQRWCFVEVDMHLVTTEVNEMVQTTL